MTSESTNFSISTSNRKRPSLRPHFTLLLALSGIVKLTRATIAEDQEHLAQHLELFAGEMLPA